MSLYTDKQRAAALQAGVLGGVKFEVKQATEEPEGVIAVETTTGTQTFLPTPFLDLFLLRKRTQL